VPSQKATDSIRTVSGAARTSIADSPLRRTRLMQEAPNLVRHGQGEGRMRNAIVLALGLCVLPTYATAAAPLTTAPLSAGFGTANVMFCEVVNVGKTPLSLTVELMRSDGTLQGVCGPVLNPGEAAASCGGSVSAGFSYYCRFTGGSKRQVRASIVAYNDSGGSALVQTAALPAQ
jgi:hypothetical protein